MTILAIDQGTTGTTTVLYAEDGTVLARAAREIPQSYPQPGWVEHDPVAIWDSVLSTATAACRGHDRPLAVGITNQRETVLIWDADTGVPIAPAIVWQCRRTAEACSRLTDAAPFVRARTGLPIDPYFSATKLRYLLDAAGSLRHRHLRAGTIDSWLVWKLTAGAVHATDVTNAARTLLFDIHAREYADELCALFGVPREILPEVRPSRADFGVVAIDGPLRGVPILGVAGDQQAALFGQQCHARGEMKNTYGTGCFAVMNTAGQAIDSRHGLLTTLAIGVDARTCYALEGSVFVAGAALQWLRDELGLIGSAAESEALAHAVPDNGGVFLVPAFVGLGAPHWNAEARGTLVGLTRGTGRAHLVRAALEAMAYQSADVVHAMEADTGTRVEQLAVDGGAVANGFLMQFQADILGIPVRRPRNIESTSFGAACLAGLGAGVWPDTPSLRRLCPSDRVFEPAMSAGQREQLLAGWRHALRQALAT